MTADIATQIRARLDAIAAQRAGLDEEARRLRRALEALEPTLPVVEHAAEPKGTSLDEALRRMILPMTPLPAYPCPCPVPYSPYQPMDQRDVWRMPLGPQIGDGPAWHPGEVICGSFSTVANTDSLAAYGHNQD